MTPSSSALARVDLLAQQDQAPGDRRPERPHGSRGAAARGQDAALHLGEPEARALVRHAQVAGQRELEPAAHAPAVDLRDRRHAAGGRAARRRRPCTRSRRARVSGVATSSSVVSAPAENARSPAPRMISDARLAHQRARDRRGQLLLERARERVQAVGPVERQQRDRAVALAQDERHVTSPRGVSPRSAASRALGEALVERGLGVGRVPGRVRREHEVGRLQARVAGQRRLVVPDVHEGPGRTVVAPGRGSARRCRSARRAPHRRGSTRA